MKKCQSILQSKKIKEKTFRFKLKIQNELKGVGADDCRRTVAAAAAKRVRNCQIVIPTGNQHNFDSLPS